MSGVSIAAEVAAAIREVGNATGNGPLIATLIRPAAQPTNPWDAPASAPSLIPVAVMVESYSQGLIDGTLIRAEDRRVMMEATGIVPTTADRISISGKEYAILSVAPEAPSGVALFYNLHCRE
jgi:hypothetical protein